VIGQVLNGDCEILGLNDCFSDFLIGFQLHCSQVLKEEKHNESSCYICYDHHKSDYFLLQIELIQEQKVDIAGFACGLHEVHIGTLIFKRVNSAICWWEEGFIDYQVARVLPIALILERVVHLFRIGRIEKRVSALVRGKFYAQAILGAG
jgi:hypothetical protein